MLDQHSLLLRLAGIVVVEIHEMVQALDAVERVIHG